jgi:predicted metal-dependent enzyme (double-stranded beta helix superfamily)
MSESDIVSDGLEPQMTAIDCTRATTPAAELLVRELGAAIEAGGDPAEVALTLQRHLQEPELLTRAQRRSSAEGYRTNVVHVDSAGRFSVVALVWRPGQRTPIHSHRSWCVVGVHRGVEEERTFGVLPHGTIELADVRRYPPGAVTWLADETEVHDVANAGSEVAISLHVYGLDYRRLGSSILDVYEGPIVDRRAPSTAEAA